MIHQFILIIFIFLKIKIFFRINLLKIIFFRKFIEALVIFYPYPKTSNFDLWNGDCKIRFIRATEFYKSHLFLLEKIEFDYLPDFHEIFLKIITRKQSEKIISIINSSPRDLHFMGISFIFFKSGHLLPLINSFVPFNPEKRFPLNKIKHCHVCIFSLFKPNESIRSLLPCFRVFWYFAASHRTILFSEIVFEFLLVHILWNAFYAHVTIFNWVVWFAIAFDSCVAQDLLRMLLEHFVFWILMNFH